MLVILNRAREEFQSTLPHGERPGGTITYTSTTLFQSTLPHGERLVFPYPLFPNNAFQSTLPHGERLCRMR